MVRKGYRTYKVKGAMLKFYFRGSTDTKSAAESVARALRSDRPSNLARIVKVKGGYEIWYRIKPQR